MIITSRRARTAAAAAACCCVLVLLLVLALALAGGAGSIVTEPFRTRATTGTSMGDPAWPPTGQAALRVGRGDIDTSSTQLRAAPIASLTKIMTALLVLEHDPMPAGSDGFTMIISADDVIDTERRRARGESVIDVQPGEELSERQALLALLLPSAGNLAGRLAVQVAGSEAPFVDLMNARAESLQMTSTDYADASGFDPASRSTARDQVILASVALQNPDFAWLVRQRQATLPIAGTVRSTNRLLGREGYSGVKTGSHRAAGGCLVFAVRRTVHGRSELILGAVLGQRGPDLLDAAFDATKTLVDSLPA